VLFKRGYNIYQFNLAVNHRFCSDEKDWGFTKFVEISKLIQPYEGQVPLIVNDKTNISVYIKVIKDPTGVLWHNFKKYVIKLKTAIISILIFIFFQLRFKSCHRLRRFTQSRCYMLYEFPTSISLFHQLLQKG
jgi:hypothetical protein